MKYREFFRFSKKNVSEIGLGCSSFYGVGVILYQIKMLKMLYAQCWITELIFLILYLWRWKNWKDFYQK